MISTRLLQNLSLYRYGNKSSLYIKFLASRNSWFCTTAEKVEQTQSENVTPESLSQEISKLTEDKNSLASQLAELEGKYKRTLADRENVRNRLEKQITEAKQYGIQGFCKDLLEVTDIFEKAIGSVPTEELKTDTNLKNLYDGLVMTESTLQSVFKRHKLHKLELDIGDKFNPAEQEAMFEVAVTESQNPGTIAHVLRSGWKLHDRCIRSAQVGVFKE